MGASAARLLLVVAVAAAIDVDTTSGRLRGAWNASIGAYQYMGVPYAAPPVGSLRWAPPEPYVVPPGVRDCRSFEAQGPRCPQRNGPSSSFATSEDCLRLSVWTPSARAADLPVMLFFHGGSLVGGGAVSIQAADGGVGSVASAGVVSVSVAYRLGVLGFLASPALEAARGTSGNYGLLDAIAALKWVKENARAFGGDPEKITVYGQSSGGSLVFALLASPLARGLFSRAISMSGSPRLNSTLEEAYGSWHRAPVLATSCADLIDGPKAALRACLYSLDASDLVAAQPDDWDAATFSYAVFDEAYRSAPLLLVDGHALPDDYRNADYDATVETIVGTTRQEADFSPGDDARGWTGGALAAFLTDKTAHLGADFVDGLLDVYGVRATGPPLDAQRLYSEILTDASVYCPTLFLARAMPDPFVYSTSARPGRPYAPLAPFQTFDYEPLYSFHAIDMFMLFNYTNGYEMTDGDRAYSRSLVDAFSTFARDGAAPPDWRRFRGDDGSYGVVDLRQATATTATNLKKRQCDFWLRHDAYGRYAWVN